MSTTATDPVVGVAPDLGGTQLRTGSLSFLETVGQSVANIAPTATPALNITVVAGLAGVGSWMAYLIATVGMMFVAANIGVLAKRHPMAGSYFVYIGRTLGPFAGMIAGWSMIAAYLVTAVAVVFGAQIFVGNILEAVGLASLTPPDWAIKIVFMAVIAAGAYHDIRLSSRTGVVLEVISLTIIILITALVLMKHGGVVDPVQLDVKHLEFGGVMSALAFAVFSFVGFESAATLAKEARDPTKAIPRAVWVSAGVAGLFFVVIAYCMMLAVGDESKVIGDSSSPFAEITNRAGLAWAAAIVYFAALISMFACGLACINAVSRLMFSMGRYRYLHAAVGKVHEKHHTPYVAIIVSSVLTVIICMLLRKPAPVDAFGYTGTFATFGFLVVYLLICVVAPLDLKRSGGLRFHHVALGVIGVLLMGFVIFGSIYPVPPAPYNLIPYMFLGYLLVGALWYSILRGNAPTALAGMQHDLEI